MNSAQTPTTSAGHDDLLRQLATAHGVEDMVEIQAAIPYRDALAEMLRADGLLVLQASNCNDQIPAKLYEYLRARRPVLAFTDPTGDTAAALLAAGVRSIAPLDQPGAIADTLMRFVNQPTADTLPADAAVAAASRYGRTKRFAEILGAFVSRGQPGAS